MGVLFISHSSLDNTQAVRVRDWLKSQGWDDVFLDLDPGQGLAVGQRWQSELKRAGETCAAVIVLVSPNWLASRWCQTEFLVADQLGKRIFPLFVAPTPFDDLPLELKAKFQLADISSPEKEAEGFQRLAIGLKRAGLDPSSFDWPPEGEPNRAVYRGLQPLDVQDAAIFFGREAAITRGLDELRRLRDGAAQRAVVILGASGAGKSSFLRAGLIARLKRDEQNFVVLPIIRPERAALTGQQGLNAALSTSIRSGAELASAIAAVRQPIIDRMERHATAAGEPYHGKPPTVVIAIDQAEELFGPDNVEGASFCEIVEQAVAQDGNALVVATIRTDAYGALQNVLMADRQYAFSLPAIAPGSFKEIIEGPARLARPALIIEPALTQQLLMDLDTADALPILAFTLERLRTQYGAKGRLSLSDYGDAGLGGIKGAIQSAVNAVLGDGRDSGRLALARRLFIPMLVQVDPGGVRRRVARYADLPADTRALADDFVAQRLLVRDGENIEVAHEAILRQWPTLAGWIAEDQEALITLEGVRAAARDWRAHADARQRRRENWLLHRGERVSDAQRTAGKPDFAHSVDDDMRAYIAACARQERRAVAARRGVQVMSVLASLVFLALSVVAARAAYRASESASEARRQAAAAQASSDFLISTFEIAVPARENPDTISARMILDRGAARIRRELISQPMVRAQLMATIARAYNTLGLPTEASVLIESDIATLRSLGADGVSAQLMLARSYRQQGDLERALEVANAALTQLNADPRARPDLDGYAAETRGVILFDLGRTDEGLADLGRAEAAYRDAPEPDPMAIARVINNRGTLLSDLGEYDQSRAALLQANALYAEHAGEQSLYSGQNFYGLALNEYGAGDLAAATNYVARSRAILSDVLQPENPALGDVITLQGELQYESGAYAEAATSLEQALTVYSGAFAGPNLSAGFAQYYLALIRFRESNFPEALRLLDQTKINFDTGLPADHPNQGDLLVRRALVLRAMNRGAEAASLCASGLAIIAASVGEDHPMHQEDRELCAAMPTRGE